MFIQATLALLIGFAAGSTIGPNAGWIIGGLSALIPLLFAWGFYNHLAGAYNAYIILSLVSAPRQLEGLASGSVATFVGLAISIGLLVFVCYVRQKLFPDLAFLAPKKVKGRYVFSG
ncbi:hypothetical protein D3C85_768550 [compost metagenome]